MISGSIIHYRILAPLGAGGMGEVFRARDTRLNRDVAIKVLSAGFAADPDRLRRFELEAKALAALNHPNILTVFDVGQHEGQPYLVTELLEGRTLRELLADSRQGPLPVRLATDYALQIASGLSAAHDQGLIHRDLKPENLFVSSERRLKILDFGLAKLREADRPPDSTTASKAPTHLLPAVDATEPGRIMGTPGYMAPEQVRGEPVDHRADLFAFGCVLYEMLTGRRPFRRDTAIATMAAIMNEEAPDLTDTNSDLPPSLVRIVQRCLEKNPQHRFQSAKDLAFALETVAPAPKETSVLPAAPPPKSKTPAWAVALVASVLFLTLAWWFFHQSPQPANQSAPPTAAPDRKSVAVLPFVNMSADKADEYLSDGMTEELLNVLAKIKGLRVPGRSSSFAFKNKNEEGIFRRVGEMLNVQAVLEGSVRKAGNQLRITAQLINVADGFHIWSETYDRDMTNIFAIQSDIAARVADALKVQLLGATTPLKKPTENIEAYQLYLQGRQLWNRRTGESLQQAVKYFEEAIAKDPGYALAYAGLADCYVLLPVYAGMPPCEAEPKLRAAAQQALKLDDSLAEPHTALAWAKAYFDWDWPGAEAEFRRAIALNPNYATAHHWFAVSHLIPLHRFDEALAELYRAQELDPLSQSINVSVGECLEFAGKIDASIQVFQKQIVFDPSFLRTRIVLGRLYISTGKLPEAIAELETARRLAGTGAYPLSVLGLAYARAGRTNEARALLGQLQELQRQGLDYRVGIARVQHGLGEDEGALASLEQAVEDRATAVTWLEHEGFGKDLRSHPRFQALLKRMNLVK